jgi:N-acetylmuramoyl-L-alanine amidase
MSRRSRFQGGHAAALGLCCLLARLCVASPLVVIDPGHGGSKAGAVGPKGELEKDIALTLSVLVKQQLQKQLGARVRMTREKDEPVSLASRVALANSLQPDVFLSIHLNSMPTKKLRLESEGIETYFLSASASGENARKVAARENAEVQVQSVGTSHDTLSIILADLQRSEMHADSSRLAYSIQQSLVQDTKAQDRGVQQAPFFVLTGISSPAVLIEAGYLSHPREGAALSDGQYQSQIANAIVKGIAKFLQSIEQRDGKKP